MTSYADSLDFQKITWNITILKRLYLHSFFTPYCKKFYKSPKFWISGFWAKLKLTICKIRLSNLTIGWGMAILGRKPDQNIVSRSDSTDVVSRTLREKTDATGWTLRPFWRFPMIIPFRAITIIALIPWGCGLPNRPWPSIWNSSMMGITSTLLWTGTFRFQFYFCKSF